MHKIIIIHTLELNYRISFPPIRVQAMAPPFAINKEQILGIFFRIMADNGIILSTATTYLSISLNGGC